MLILLMMTIGSKSADNFFLLFGFNTFYSMLCHTQTPKCLLSSYVSIQQIKICGFFLQLTTLSRWNNLSWNSKKKKKHELWCWVYGKEKHKPELCRRDYAMDLHLHIFLHCSTRIFRLFIFLHQIDDVKLGSFFVS